MNFPEVLGLIILGLFFLYILARLIFKAYFKAREEYENTEIQKGEMNEN